MPYRIPRWCVALWLVASLSWAASLEQARELYLSGDLAGARSKLQELLLETEDGNQRASALELLGQLEVDERNWSAALEAWGELTDDYALSPQATAISPAIRPLQALIACECESSPSAVATPPAAETPREPSPPAEVRAPAVETPREPAPAPAVPMPVPGPTPTPVPPAAGVEPAEGLLLVGGWGVEYEASQAATDDLIEFLQANGVGVRAASTEIPAIRGVEVVLSFLLDEAKRSGADGVLFMKTRFDFRQYIEIIRYDLGGNQLWKDRTTGGTALRERQDQGKPSWGLVERAKNRLSKRIGTPDLPTRP